jgi:hypothetical protein
MHGRYFQPGIIKASSNNKAKFKKINLIYELSESSEEDRELIE